MTKLFKLTDTPALAPAKTRSQRAEQLRNPEDKPPFYIRGKQADSKDEYWVSLALEKIEKMTGLAWDYQVSVYGGRDLSGGNVLDFLVYTPGMWTILDPMGRWWHTGIHEDRSQMKNVARKKHLNLIAWFTDDTPTRDMVYAFLRQALHV